MAVALRTAATAKAPDMENTTTIALSRLVAQQHGLDVIATNIANTATPGFKAQRMLFSDWLQHEPRGAVPPGGQTESYASDRATYRERAAGTLRHTANPLDIALGNPEGWLNVQTPRGPRLTRAGHFDLSANGTIVDDDGDALLDSAGRKLQTTPSDTGLTIAGDGTISSQNGQIGRIGVVKPDDPGKLSAEGARLYAANTPTQPLAGGQMVQGALEDSNAQPIAELNRMMNDLREFQFTTQLVQAENDRQNNAVDKIMKKGV